MDAFFAAVTRWPNRLDRRVAAAEYSPSLIVYEQQKESWLIYSTFLNRLRIHCVKYNTNSNDDAIINVRRS